MKLYIVFLFTSVFYCIFNSFALESPAPVAKVKQGKLVGSYQKSTKGRDFESFLGIPYGKVVKRFTAPEPADQFIDSSFMAVINLTACPQYQSSLKMVIGDENCLTLNVFRPKMNRSDNRKLPVMVYISGEGFNAGSTLLYGAEHFMDKDVVLVLMNYRLGILGFLSTGDDAATGNYGLMDQLLALQWVQDNIEAFGGDANKVTIFGSSAGAASVMYQIVSPKSQGLFHAAIIQSGSSLCSWALDEKPLQTATIVAQKLNCPTGDTMALVECLRTASYQDLAEISTKSFNLTIGPVVEMGNNAGFLNEHPYVLLKEGRFNKVPVIIGVLLHEGSHFSSTWEQSFRGTKKEFFQSGLKCYLGNITDRDFVESQADLVKDIGEAFFNNVDFNDENAVRIAGVQLVSTSLFDGCNDLTIKLLAAQDIPVYSYVFTFISEILGKITTYSGEPDVYHGSDAPYFFTSQLFKPKYSKDDKDFIEKMTTMWTNFAYFFDPNPTGSVDWTTTSPNMNQFLRINKHMEMDDNFRNEEISHWLPFQIKYLESQLE